jgi:hypothetical protein
MAWNRCIVCGARTLTHDRCQRHRPALPCRALSLAEATERRRRERERIRRKRASYGVRDELLACSP